MVIEAINPTTGDLIKEYREMTLNEVDDILLATNEDYLKWKKTSFSHRVGLMKKAANILRDNAEKYGKLMAEEMGKPIKGGISEAKKCAGVCDYYAENTEKFLKPEIIQTDAKKSLVSLQPIAIVLAVMPRNFPLWQEMRFAAPALMAGNAGVLKHASNVPGCALAIEEVFQKAGFPKNIFRTLLIGSKYVDKVIENPLIKAVTLTGSTSAGTAVARKSGEMLKKTVPELGGSDPYIILDEA